LEDEIKKKIETFFQLVDLKGVTSRIENANKKNKILLNKKWQ
jgi:hypothetical protein